MLQFNRAKLIMNGSKINIYPVILSGGSGERLWPLSRTQYPKQLQSLHTDLSLLQETSLRFTDGSYGQPLIICNEKHRFIVAEHLQAINIQPKAIVLEPTGRNTAPAATVASLLLEKDNPDSIILLIPSDHIIKDVPALHNAIETAYPSAQSGYLVTFGIKPKGPEIGYGYIKKTAIKNQTKGCFNIESFTEKPNSSEAKAL